MVEISVNVDNHDWRGVGGAGRVVRLADILERRREKLAALSTEELGSRVRRSRKGPAGHDTGYYFGPTIFSDVTNDSELGMSGTRVDGRREGGHAHRPAHPHRHLLCQHLRIRKLPA